jgi:hypothetical protein
MKALCDKLFSGSGWALFTMFVWEMVEELLENCIAYALSSAVAIFVTKALSTLFIITATQGIKVSIKRFLIPFFKNLTYKEGLDKMSKVKSFFTWLWCNKKTLIGTASVAVAGLSGTGVIDVKTLPALVVGGFNLTPFIYYGCLAVLALLGVFGVGIEKIEVFFNRVGLIKAQKAEAKIVKEAKKELKAEQKQANQTQAQKEKEDAKKLAEEQAKAEKAKADAEHKAKIEQAKAKLVAEQQAKNSAQK